MGRKGQIILLLFIALFSMPVHAQQTTPGKSIVVSKDGSGDFSTIQEAVSAVRDFSEEKVYIHVKKGVYREKLVIPAWKVNISLKGEGKDQTVITYDDFAGKNGINTYTSHTMLVEGNDFSAEGLTVENSAGNVGQAVALHVEADRVIMVNCRIKGNQDTLFPSAENSRQYYLNCEIEGTTDFIFGAATVVFERCQIRSKKNSYITAASTGRQQKYGFVFLNCRLIGDEGLNKVYLGRPWRPYAKTVFINTDMGKHVMPAGWRTWNDNENHLSSYYAEFGSSGPGGNTNERVGWSHQLTKKELKAYTLKKIFSGRSTWVPMLENK